MKLKSKISSISTMSNRVHVCYTTTSFGKQCIEIPGTFVLFFKLTSFGAPANKLSFQCTRRAGCLFLILNKVINQKMQKHLHVIGLTRFLFYIQLNSALFSIN